MSIRFFPNRLGRDPGSGLVEVPISRVGPYDTLVIVVDHLRSSVYVRPSTAPWSLVATWQSRSSWLMDRWIAVCFSVDPPFPSKKLPLGDRITRYQQSDTNDDLKNHPLNSLWSRRIRRRRGSCGMFARSAFAAYQVSLCLLLVLQSR